jgi:NAD(P)-dependent dehydrogenase (short-subunit alcohol dehydrogenase family)
MAGRLEGKVCMITGTGGGIGRASALAFAREGARVIGCDSNSSAAQRTLEEVLAANGEMISMHPCGLFDKGNCEALVTTALEHFGRLDVVFNNAGRLYPGWMSDPSDEFWFRTIDEELHIVFMLCKAAWAALCESSGNIINMASNVGHTTFRMFPAIAHTSAKGAIIAMTRHLAMEGRQHGIRANSISPGVIGTPAVLAQAQVREWDAAMRGRMMRGRYGRPEEVAAVAVFLASDESSFINAADIVVDDGLTAWG